MTSELSCWEKGDAAKTGRNEQIRSTTRISKVLFLSFIRTSSRQLPTLDFPLPEIFDSSQRASILVVVVGSLGFVPSPQGDVSPLFIVSSRSIPPFSFIGFIQYIVENSLAGDELDESETCQLPSVWQSAGV